MYVDIHTHQLPKTGSFAIQNLTVLEAETILTTEKQDYFSVGCHPWFIEQCTEQTLEQIKKWTMDLRTVLIGECGLDKNSKVPLKTQILVFEKHIEFSEKAKKPLIIHCVGCFNDLFEIKRRLKPSQLWIIHGFRGKPELAKQALNLNCALSFGVHYNPESVKITPLEKLYIETDESSINIEDLYQQISFIKTCKVEDLFAGKRLIECHQLK
jgi:TatD DNase family protein